MAKGNTDMSGETAFTQAMSAMHDLESALRMFDHEAADKLLVSLTKAVKDFRAEDEETKITRRTND